MRGTHANALSLLIGQGFDHLAWGAHYHGVVWNFLALGNQRVCADDAIFTDLCAVQHNGIDADQRPLANITAVQHDLMADGDMRPDNQRITGIRMQHRSVLHIGALADSDLVVIAAHHCIEPYAGVLLQQYITHHRG